MESKMAVPIKEVAANGITKTKYKAHLADCVVLTHDNKILLQYRPPSWRKDPDNDINLFGGHVEDGEAITAALIRELHEETGAQINPDELHFIAAVTEAWTDHTELVHIHFWHDREQTITGCYEAEARHYKNLDDALSQAGLMDYARWALIKCKEKGLLK